MTPVGQPRILVVVAEMGHNTQRELQGVSQFAKRAGYTVDIVEGRHFGDRPDFAKWIEFWQPAGLVVDPGYALEALADKAAMRLPIVVWDGATLDILPESCPKVVSDPEAIAEAAARELLRTGFSRFAYVPSLGNPPYSQERATAFAATMGGLDRAVSVYRPAPDEVASAVGFREGLVRFLEALEKPCGVFAANDPTAVLVARTCAERGLRVPDDIALIGVDDSAEYCERGEPTLTSIRVDIERGGYRAAEMLASLIRRGGRVPRRGTAPVARYGVAQVVRRASTCVLRARDGRVSRAMEWIRLNACTPIDVGDVVSVMGCSRRLANLRFRQATGHTILDEIHARRIDEAKTLLRRPDVPIGDIPSRCGYVRGPCLGILFKRATGCTMRAWRKTALVCGLPNS